MSKETLVIVLKNFNLSRKGKEERGNRGLFSYFTYVYSLLTQSRGFTLSEVIITLGIIGVIAAITVPVVMNNTQDMELKTAFKNTYSILYNTVLRIKDDNGGTMVGWNDGSSNCMRDKFLKYLSSVKTCDAGSVSTDCWTDNTWTDTWYTYPASSRAVLNNGILLSFWVQGADNTCNNLTWLPPPVGFCMYIVADTNGFKKPNIPGKDIFGFWITKDGIVPDIYGGNNGNLCCGQGKAESDYLK